MKLKTWIEPHFIYWVDRFYDAIPRPQPEREQLLACKIVSHRGDHNNHTVIENTLAAFDRAQKAGVWGIELDLRWTKDLVPVVYHDPDLKRLDRLEVSLNELTWGQLTAKAPQVPKLETVIERYGGRLHLMTEIKAEPYPRPTYQRDRIKALLSGLTAADDYHLLTLTPEMYDHYQSFPPECLLPVSDTNFRAISRLALSKPYGGLLGHYFLLSNRRLERHLRAGQTVGTGYPRSLNTLYREINRGVSWVFSNHAVNLQAALEAVLQKMR